MKNSILAAGLSLLFFTACNSEKKDNTSDSTTVDTTILDTDTTTSEPADSAAMMKAWEAYMKPGNEHQMLSKSVGNWEAAISFYAPDGSVASTSPGIKAETKMVLGDRYQQSTYKGDMNGMPFEGMNTIAFDNSKKVYISTWIDNMGTGLMYSEGTFNEAKKTMIFKGTATDASSGKQIPFREVFTIIDDNNQLMEMYDTKDGKETKTMSIKLTRK
ncbi:MAG: DUF1579 domain-containing protein [Pedobacter sp.]|uniref:DUF1579 domain-containing protein n=1 Tax=Pedobacter sp. TaxID=1411316 RepID=UPI002808F1AD|nr:DUF1579 domain-containing protein [Pedobacter sp.]MDQ8003825.1 DUF1579 domain-containing protein [Pedobacter sp.]